MRRGAGFAPAKINLALHVTGQRADGYHLLDSLVVFADVGDVLTARPAARSSLTVTGPMAEGVPDGPENLVLKAADWAGGSAAFYLEKHLPAAAGIGGGSADAAAALRLLAQMSARRDAYADADAGALGADVPVCLLGRAARMRGVGDEVLPLDPFPPLHAVLVNPRVSVPTPAVFKALREKENLPLPPLPVFQEAEDVLRYLAQTRNDLEPPACAACPVIHEVTAALGAQAGARLVRMSGSGATCFALFSAKEDANAAAKALAAAHPHWWVRAAKLS